MWVAEGVTETRQRAEHAPLCLLRPLPHIQRHSAASWVAPPWRTPKAPPLTGAPKQKKLAEMKKEIKAPEKIQLSDEEIANLSHAEFETLVIRMLTEMIEYRCKIEEEVKAMKSEIKKTYREPTVKERKLGLKSMVWSRKRNKHSPRTE